MTIANHPKATHIVFVFKQYKKYIIKIIHTFTFTYILCQKFRHCLKKLAIVDVTLERLGTTLNYQQLYTKTIWVALGWFAIVILINYVHVLFLQYQSNYDNATIICISIIISYCSHVSLLNDLIIARTLGLVSYIYIYIHARARACVCV